jgi:hypothetical protein
MAKATKTQPTLYTIYTLLSEVEEKFDSFQKVLRRLRRAKPGSEAYLEVLAELNTELFTLYVGAKEAFDTVEEFEDCLPETDD